LSYRPVLRFAGPRTLDDSADGVTCDTREGREFRRAPRGVEQGD